MFCPKIKIWHAADCLMLNCMQLLCRALGGRTGRSTKGWDIGVSCIHPTSAAARLFAPLKLPVHMPVIEFHQDEVWELPPNAEVLARSDKTRVEMFRYGDGVMGVQGHPEYSKDILMSIADRLLQRSLILVRIPLLIVMFCSHLLIVFSYKESNLIRCVWWSEIFAGLPGGRGEGELRREAAGQGAVEEGVQGLPQGEAPVAAAAAGGGGGAIASILLLLH